MTNPPTPEDKIDEIIVLGFLYGIESERLTQDEVDHRVAGFKHTQGFKEARHALLALLNETESTAQLNLIGYYQQVGDNKTMDWMGLFADNERLVRDELAQLRAATPKEDI